ncbi:MAG: hypothetical protein U0793_11855 [Gemmataceae bacterium]
MHWPLRLLLTILFPSLGADGPIDTLVVTNPADVRFESVPMSPFARWIAVQKRGILTTTNEDGDDVASAVERAIRERKLTSIDHVILVGSLRAIPMEKRKNPLPGKDAWIETEPLAPRDGAPFSFAVGRIFHRDPKVVMRMLLSASAWHGPPARPPKALVVGNPGDSLPLVETFARASAAELKNAGYDVTPLIGHDSGRAEVRRRLPEQTVFLFEGHMSTLVRDYEAHRWTEPLRPSLILLQSCLVLTEERAGPFLERGALAVAGSSTRTFSGSGGAVTLSYLDALLHDGQTLGQGMRQAKNFLLAFAKLKEQRLTEKSQLGGANLRTAWAFTLWGDPTLKLPLASSNDRLPAVTHAVKGSSILIHIPVGKYPRLKSERYEVELTPNARLGGLLQKKDDDRQELIPLVFREVHLPDVLNDVRPTLKSKLPRKSWVFLWDPRRRTGYLLVRPNPGQRELRFDVAASGTP